METILVAALAALGVFLIVLALGWRDGPDPMSVEAIADRLARVAG